MGEPTWETVTSETWRYAAASSGDKSRGYEMPTTERLAVPGGWLYRVTRYPQNAPRSGSAMHGWERDVHVAVTFVPEPRAEGGES